MITGAYRDLFAATATAAGALTGLLFVAMSVASRQALVQGPRVIRQIRASAALLAFTSSLAVSLFGLVPDINVGYPAVVVAIFGIFFTAAAIRSITASRASPAQIRGQTWLIIILLMISFTELIAGAAVIASPRSGTSVQVIDYAIVTSLLVGIGRAWEFIGERDTGILASLGILSGRAARTEAVDAADGRWAGDPGGPGRPSPEGPADSAGRDDEPG